jgi:hypothetical protein
MLLASLFVQLPSFPDEICKSFLPGLVIILSPNPIAQIPDPSILVALI